MFELNGKMPYEYGCFHVHTEIASPEPRIEMLEIPLRDGAINTSALLSNTVHYSTREIVLGLETPVLRSEWPLIQETLMRDLHGQAVQLTLADDPNWYWEGYAVVEQMEDKGASAGWTIRITAQPFKRARAEKYLDYFVVPGTQITRTLHIDSPRAYPTFTTSAAGIQLEYRGITYTLPRGESSVYGIFFVEGNNEIKLNGTGNVTIKCREATL